MFYSVSIEPFHEGVSQSYLYYRYNYVDGFASKTYSYILLITLERQKTDTPFVMFMWLSICMRYRHIWTDYVEQ